MRVTVFALRRAPVGQDARLLALGLQGIEEQAQAPGQVRPQDRCFYQGVASPDLLVRVTDWESCEAYLACRTHSRISRQLDELSTGSSERYFFRPLRQYRHLRYLPEVMTCTLLEAHPGETAALLAFVEQVVRPAVQALPGLVLRGLYQDVDTPERLLIRHGWGSRREWEQAQNRLTPAIWSLQARLSVRKLRFVGQSRTNPRLPSRTVPRS
jgi:hypothetical protein